MIKVSLAKACTGPGLTITGIVTVPTAIQPGYKKTIHRRQIPMPLSGLRSMWPASPVMGQGLIIANGLRLPIGLLPLMAYRCNMASLLTGLLPMEPLSQAPRATRIRLQFPRPSPVRAVIQGAVRLAMTRLTIILRVIPFSITTACKLCSRGSTMRMVRFRVRSMSMAHLSRAKCISEG